MFGMEQNDHFIKSQSNSYVGDLLFAFDDAYDGTFPKHFYSIFRRCEEYNM
jgi:hypothetical protein